jgi:hypothetical protein
MLRALRRSTTQQDPSCNVQSNGLLQNTPATPVGPIHRAHRRLWTLTTNIGKHLPLMSFFAALRI